MRLRAQLNIRREQWQPLQGIFDEMAAFLAESTPGPEAEKRLLQLWQYRSADLALLQAEAALGEGRRIDALAFYGSALAARVEGNKLQAAARKVWDELGGTEDGWRAWLALATPSPERRAIETPGHWEQGKSALAAIELIDLGGRRWAREDLIGKVAFLNVWATWCGPCRMELPYLQKLQERLAERSDVILITLNIDDNPGLVEPYMKKNGFTFPVLLAKEFIDRSYQGGIPQNWIIDRAGILRFQQLGFGGEDGAQWTEQALRLIETLAEAREVQAQDESF
jgi:thiol-disulfide isomerase/thioredoxin